MQRLKVTWAENPPIRADFRQRPPGGGGVSRSSWKPVRPQSSRGRDGSPPLTSEQQRMASLWLTLAGELVKSRQHGCHLCTLVHVHALVSMSCPWRNRKNGFGWISGGTSANWAGEACPLTCCLSSAHWLRSSETH